MAKEEDEVARAGSPNNGTISDSERSDAGGAVGGCCGGAAVVDVLIMVSMLSTFDRSSYVADRLGWRERLR